MVSNKPNHWDFFLVSVSYQLWSEQSNDFLQQSSIGQNKQHSVREDRELLALEMLYIKDITPLKCPDRGSYNQTETNTGLGPGE